jgi:hypothetical protein
MKNEIFQKIFELYENEIERLYEEESACLIIFRILKKTSQQLIMRLINIDEEINLSLQSLVQEIKWSDIYDNHEQSIKEDLKILHWFKIIPDRDKMILNKMFKKNMFKIINNGISLLSIDNVKKKNKTWNECYDIGLKALEKYLVKIHEFDNVSHVNLEDEKIKFLVNSNIIKKEGSVYKLTHQTFAILLGDKQYQIRMMLVKYLLYNRCDNREKNFKFLNFLFSICTLDIGTVYFFYLGLFDW